MDDFLVRAALAGLGVAVMTGPLGCFIVWRRMAYFGGALAHSALLGVALGLLLGLSPTAGIILVCLLFALAISGLQRMEFLANDTVLGILAHVTLAVGLMVVSLMESLRIDLMAYLFGDVLAVAQGDLLVIWGTVVLVLLGLGWLWERLLSATVSRELAAVEGGNPARDDLMFVLLIAAAIAVGMKVVGVLLIISMLIIPAAAARSVARTPEGMAVTAILIGVFSVFCGLGLSLWVDVPAGPAIVTASGLVFLASLARGRGIHGVG